MKNLFPQAEVYLFDMDETLISADCDVTWKHFAVKHGLAPDNALDEAERFYQEYCAGTLDIDEFMAFQLAEFTGKTPAEAAEMSRRHFEEFIRPAMRKDAVELVNAVKAAGKVTALLSSTNKVVSSPVAAAFGIDAVLGTQLEQGNDGRYTGRITGLYAVQENKVAIARQFGDSIGFGLEKFSAYGDSFNDRFILKACGFATAVNPGDKLRALALENNWHIEEWK
ncbi:MAG: HAD-IB family hydrolase [Lentisphaeria bacterium]|nr:HAD-IB family hydrolase [Lentisphaeria bacterium]